MILFKSYNMEEMFNLLVVDDPNSASYDAHKEVRELKNVMSSNGSNYFKSYLLRTTVSLIVSAFPIVIFVYYWHVFDSGVLYCYVHERYWYECSGHPVQFYMVKLFPDLPEIKSNICFRLSWPSSKSSLLFTSSSICIILLGFCCRALVSFAVS